MKTVFLRGRYLIFAAALGLASLYSMYRVGPGPHDGYLEANSNSGVRDNAIRQNLRKYLTSRYGYRIDEDGIVLAPRFGIPDGYGYSVIGWFCGLEVGGSSVDLYSVNAFMSSAGVPLSVDRPVNVSRTPDADERILDAIKDRVLFASTRPSESLVLVMLSFEDDGALKGSGDRSSMAHAIDAEQRFGRLRLPWRVELIAEDSPNTLSAQLFQDRIEGRLGETDFSYTLRNGRVEPRGLFTVVQGSTGEASSWYTWRDVLNASALLGEGRLVTLLDMVDGLGNRFESILKDESLTPLIPPQVPTSIKSDELNWPPRLPFGKTGDLFWKNSPLCKSADCPIKMLSASDEARLAGVTVMGIDSRRLGLQYQVGRKYPRSTTGLVGAEPTALQVETKTLLRLPITNRGANGRTGAVASDRVLIPPQTGQPTVLMNNRGQVGFGLWHGGVIGDDWSSLWQRSQPLIEGGFAVHAMSSWRQMSHVRHPESRVFRSALGLSTDGHMLYAFGDNINASQLSNAMIQAGTVFAIPLLDHRPSEAVLHAGRIWDDGVTESLEAPLSDISDALEYFLVYQTERLPSAIENRSKHWSDTAGRFRTHYQSGGYTLLSKLSLSADELETSSGVTVYAFDSLQLRGHLLPGWAEPRPKDSERLDSLRLPSEPLLAINIGLRNQRSPFGMIFERRVWRQPKRGALSLVADGRGTLRFGTYGSRNVPDTVRWFTLIQGPPLVIGGEAVGQNLANSSGVPSVAVGLSKDVVFFIVSEDGNRASLATTAKLLELKDLMLLGERGTSETGILHRYFSQKEKLYSTDSLTDRLTPFRAARSFDTSLLFTGRVAQPQASAFSGKMAP